MRRTVIATLFTVFVGLLSAQSVSAAPITIGFSGNWLFYDLGTPGPGQAAFEAAFASYGIVSGGCSTLGCNSVGTPLTLSMTINPNSPVNSLGTHTAGLISARLNLGPLTYTMGPANLQPSLGFISQMSGPTLSANGLTFAPQWFNLLVNDQSGTHDLASTLANISSQRTFSFVNSFGFGWGFSDLKVTSVSVPEPSSLAAIGSALAAFAVTRRMRARSKRDRKQSI